MCVIRKYIFCVENQDVSYLQKYVLSVKNQDVCYPQIYFLCRKAGMCVWNFFPGILRRPVRRRLDRIFDCDYNIRYNNEKQMMKRGTSTKY